LLRSCTDCILEHVGEDEFVCSISDATNKHQGTRIAKPISGPWWPVSDERRVSQREGYQQGHYNNKEKDQGGTKKEKGTEVRHGPKWLRTGFA